MATILAYFVWESSINQLLAPIAKTLLNNPSSSINNVLNLSFGSNLFVHYQRWMRFRLHNCYRFLRLLISYYQLLNLSQNCLSQSLLDRRHYRPRHQKLLWNQLVTNQSNLKSLLQTLNLWYSILLYRISHLSRYRLQIHSASIRPTALSFVGSTKPPRVVLTD